MSFADQVNEWYLDHVFYRGECRTNDDRPVAGVTAALDDAVDLAVVRDELIEAMTKLVRDNDTTLILDTFTMRKLDPIELPGLWEEDDDSGA